MNILNDNFKEVGNGVKTGLFNPPNDGDPTNYNAVMLTEDFRHAPDLAAHPHWRGL